MVVVLLYTSLLLCKKKFWGALRCVRVKSVLDLVAQHCLVLSGAF